MGHHVNVSGPEVVGNAIVNHMEHVAKKRRWQCDVKQKIANVDQSKFGSMTWEEMNNHNWKLSKDLLAKGNLCGNKGQCIGLKCVERSELCLGNKRELETPTRVEPAVVGVPTTSAASSSQSQPPAAPQPKAAPRPKAAPEPKPQAIAAAVATSAPRRGRNKMPAPAVHPLAVCRFQIFTLGCAQIARCCPGVQSAIDMNNAFNMKAKNWEMDELMPWAQTFHFGGSGAS